MSTTTATPTHRPVPGNPHPDVLILVQLILDMEPGGTITKELAAHAIGCPAESEILIRRMTAARKLAVRDHAVNTVAARAIGWHRETPGEATARMSGKEIPGLHRKSRRIGRQVGAIDVGQLSTTEKAGYFATRTILNVATVATAPAARKKFLGMAQKSLNVTPMSEALKLLGNSDSNQ